MEYTEPKCGWRWKAPTQKTEDGKAMTTKTQDTRGAVDEANTGEVNSGDDTSAAAETWSTPDDESSTPDAAVGAASADTDAATLTADTNSDDPDSEAVAKDHHVDDQQTSAIDSAASDTEVTAEAAPSLANWLSEELRPTASKSAPPPADGAGEADETEVLAATASSLTPPPSPETLAPLALPSDELDDEDLAVLPLGSRKQSSSLMGKVLVAALGALVAIFVFTKFWSPGTTALPNDETTAAPAAAAPGSDPIAAPPQPTGVDDPAAPPAESTDVPTKPSYHGPWLAPRPAAEDETEEQRRARGPSVGRFPDLPPEHWSELRRKERERRAAKEAEAEAAAAGQ